jgi:tRNA dimethylallyltransferase
VTLVVVIFGPTASGKTDVIERLSTGSPYKIEIVSADSMQVYRGMDIGTAKPSVLMRARLPYHLIDIRNPSEQFTSGDFVRCADEVCTAITSHGAVPIVSGGTGFYLKNFIQGLPESPPADPVIRQALKDEFRNNGAELLVQELAACDPVSAARIHRNDTYRLIRALEVFRLTGVPLSSFAVHCTGTSYQFLLIGLYRPRNVLYQRINHRCECMFHAGLADEVHALYDAGYTPADPGLRAIGYREFFEETTPGSFRLVADEGTVPERVAQNCRHYAKRQTTYFQSMPDVLWIDADDEPVSLIKSAMDTFFTAKH